MRASQAAGEAEEASSHSSSLNNRLERLQGEVARASRAEKEVKERLETTQRQLREERELREGKGEEVEGLRKRVGELEQERRLLEDRLAHSKAIAEEARQEVREEVERREEAVRILQEASRSYILSSQIINADVSELRQQLGDSLDMVHNASRAHLQSGLLDR